MDRQTVDAASQTPVLVHRVIARLNTGGPAMHVANLSRDLDRLGFVTRLITGRITEDEGDMSYYAHDRGVDVVEIPAMTRLISPIQDLKVLWSLFRIFRVERPLIVHTHTAKGGALGRLAAVLAGVPIRIHTYHGHVLGGTYFASWKTRLFIWIEQQLGRGTHTLIALTHGQKREMVDELEIGEEDQYEVVPLGLDLERFRTVDPTSRRKVRDALGIPPEALVVGMVGRMVPVKNHELFFDSVAILREKGVGDLHVIIVGSGEREGHLKRYAEGLGLVDDVHWLGWRRDLPELLAAMDAVALTSHDEGTPVALIEAMVAGVPVVAREVGGVGEVLGDGRFGRLVVSPDPDQFAEALHATLSSPPNELDQHRARTRALDLYGARRLARDIGGLYRRHLGNLN